MRAINAIIISVLGSSQSAETQAFKETFISWWAGPGSHVHYTKERWQFPASCFPLGVSWGQVAGHVWHGGAAANVSPTLDSEVGGPKAPWLHLHCKGKRKCLGERRNFSDSSTIWHCGQKAMSCKIKMVQENRDKSRSWMNRSHGMTIW